MQSAQPPTPVPAPLPKKSLMILAMINLNEGLQMNLLWSFVPFQVAQWVDEDDVGFWSGIIGASFFFAQLLSSNVWASLADRFGRRPTLLLGTFFSCFSILGFGFSQSLTMAICFRSASGLFNGNVGISKTYLGEMTTKGTQAKGFALLAFTWGLGCIIGPVLGGLLSDLPADYPESFGHNDFLVTFPYSPPCIIASVFAATR